MTVTVAMNDRVVHGGIAGSFCCDLVEKTLHAHQQQSGKGKGKPARHCVHLGSEIKYIITTCYLTAY